MHTAVYKWFLVTGSLHAPRIKLRLRLKFRSTSILMVVRLLKEICFTQMLSTGRGLKWIPTADLTPFFILPSPLYNIHVI
jgi:hypothetical protein